MESKLMCVSYLLTQPRVCMYTWLYVYLNSNIWIYSCILAHMIQKLTYQLFTDPITSVHIYTIVRIFRYLDKFLYFPKNDTKIGGYELLTDVATGVYVLLCVFICIHENAFQCQREHEPTLICVSSILTQPRVWKFVCFCDDIYIYGYVLLCRSEHWAEWLTCLPDYGAKNDFHQIFTDFIMSIYICMCVYGNTHWSKYDCYVSL